MRTTWRAVGSICERVMADAQRKAGDRLDGLRRLGFDEISVRKGQRYVTVVVDHDSGRLVWAAPGRDRPRRADQHPDQTDHPPRLRLPLTRRRHRTSDAVTRRPLPTPARTMNNPRNQQ
jgi:hypothetical protein